MNNRLVGGRYRVEERIGEGGISDVYRAIDQLTHEIVALKVAHAGDESANDALIREYRFAALHNHPTLVSPYSLIYDSDDVVVVMPYIIGVDLKTWRNSVTYDDNLPETPPYSEDIISSILECMAFIHFSRHLYNDFKPSNFMVVDETSKHGKRSPNLLLLDYNLVSSFGERPSKRGTLEYVAPEILRGNNPGVRSDLYSAGSTIFEFLSGSPPFTSTDSSNLIKLITDTGRIDYSNIPDRYKDGVAALLSREPENRPPDARAVAEMMGIAEEFHNLYESRIEYYISSGKPPFADDLRKCFLEFLRGMSNKIFLVYGLNHNGGALDYLSSDLEIEGYKIQRIRRDFDDSLVSEILNGGISRETCRSSKSILLIDDLEALSDENIKTLKLASTSANIIPTVAGVRRWFKYDRHFDIFDPLRDQTRHYATGVSLKAYTKRESPGFDYSDFGDATGGDPELVYHHLLSATRSSGLDLLSEDIRPGLLGSDTASPEPDSPVRRMFDSLNRDEQSVISKLSVWGDTIPMILLVDLNSQEQRLVGQIIESGHLIRGKGTVFFPSRDSRDHIYSMLSADEKKAFHRFWAKTAEAYLEDPFESLRARALHWGLSDDIINGYKANRAAAEEYLKRGQISKALESTKRLLSLAESGGGSKSIALSLYADAAKSEGDYQGARRKYLELLKDLGMNDNTNLKAKTYKDLGDLYRSLRNPKKALYYTRRALSFYAQLSDRQGVADCHNNIGLTFWVGEEYQKALSSFGEALRVNQELENYRELAKIESNIGIINDIMGKTGEVASHFTVALRYAGRANDPRLEALISNNLGYFYLRQADMDCARQYLQEALRISERIGYTEETINSLSNLGLCHLRSGDLFISVDYNQKALEMAETLGNRHLKAESEIHLAEVCILMGNYLLSDNVIGAIEGDVIYAEDKALRAQVDLLRSKWHQAVGNYEEGLGLAESVLREAEFSGDTRLKLEAELSACDMLAEFRTGDVLNRIAVAVREAKRLGHDDLKEAAALIIARIYLLDGDYFNAEGWIERMLSSENLPKKIYIEARILSAEISYLRHRYDDAIDGLIETESTAAVSGFIPLALKAAVLLAEIFAACSKLEKGKNVAARALEYRDKLLIALPAGVSRKAFLNTAIMLRLGKTITEIDRKESVTA